MGAAALAVGLGAFAAARLVGGGGGGLEAASQQPQMVDGPKFEVDFYWPKPLPRHELLGSVTGVAIDSRDHLFVVHLTGAVGQPGGSFTTRTETGANSNPPIGECCKPAADVLEFNAEGQVVRQWGGRDGGHFWPESVSGIAVDSRGNVWIGGGGGMDTQILRFGPGGQFLGALGTAAPAAPPAAPGGAAAADTAYLGVSGAGRGAGGGGAAGRGAAVGRGGGGRGGPPALPPNSTSMNSFGGPFAIAFDESANEAFVADGSRNRRIAVVDMNSGAIKRIWGAYGRPPVDGPATQHDPSAQHFGNPVSCVKLAGDGLLYVCDRANNRIQVFRKNGEFVKEAAVAPNTKGAGSVWDVAFSRDPQQRFLYVADGQNAKIRVLDRQTLQEVTNFGDGGRQAGKFLAVSNIVTDSRGNIITGEANQGKRVQKFVFKGIGQVERSQGVAWPGRTP